MPRKLSIRDKHGRRWKRCTYGGSLTCRLWRCIGTEYLIYRDKDEPENPYFCYNRSGMDNDGDGAEFARAATLREAINLFD